MNLIKFVSNWITVINLGSVMESGAMIRRLCSRITGNVKDTKGLYERFFAENSENMFCSFSKGYTDAAKSPSKFMSSVCPIS